MSVVLDRRSVVIDEDAVLSDKQGFICRKCLRAFEAYKAAREKLLHSADTALQCIPSTPKAGASVSPRSRRRPLEVGDYDHDLTIPVKRARTAQNPTVGSSPSAQVL